MKNKLPPEPPDTLAEFLWYCMEYQNEIFVREKDEEGRWGAFSLAQITPEQFGIHVARWIEEGRVPVRVKRESEMNNEQLGTDQQGTS
jgi:hypothetical protein